MFFVVGQTVYQDRVHRILTQRVLYPKVEVSPLGSHLVSISYLLLLRVEAMSLQEPQVWSQVKRAVPQHIVYLVHVSAAEPKG